MHPVYSDIPDKSRWLNDSSVAFATRKNDVVLAYIDEIIVHYPRLSRYIRLCLICDLFFTLDYWLKVYHSNHHMQAERAPAVDALYKFVVQSLCVQFQCTINTLPRELELMFGRELTVCGANVDFKLRRAKYLEPGDADQYKLRFKNGLAYQYPWWVSSLGVSDRVLVLAESKESGAPGIHANETPGFEKFGFFVMSMSRDIYMRKHSLGNGPQDSPESGFYHSSYLAGLPTMAAGSMLIEMGIIKAVRPDSGHYHPTDSNMLALLQALRMRGVSLRHVEVYSFGGTAKTDAMPFCIERTDWGKLAAQRNENLSAYQANFGQKSVPGLGKPNLDNPRDRRIGPVPLQKGGPVVD